MADKHWTEAIRARLTEIAERYEKTAPPVEWWANDLYIRMDKNPGDVRLSELLMVERFIEEGVWMQPNYAANQVYHLMDRLGRDTTGMAGF